MHFSSVFPILTYIRDWDTVTWPSSETAFSIIYSYLYKGLRPYMTLAALFPVENYSYLYKGLRLQVFPWNLASFTSKLDGNVNYSYLYKGLRRFLRDRSKPWTYYSYLYKGLRHVGWGVEELLENRNYSYLYKGLRRLVALVGVRDFLPILTYIRDWDPSGLSPYPPSSLSILTYIRDWDVCSLRIRP